MDSYQAMEDLMWEMCAAILKPIIPNTDKYIRRMYQQTGAPDFTITDNVAFLNLIPRRDEYGQERNAYNATIGGTVIRQSMRTRVWDLIVTAYGPRSFDIVTALQDGVFSLEIKKLLEPCEVYLVPYLESPVNANEIFAGQWWQRWDLTLTFNEKYVPTEEVGHIESVSIGCNTSYR